MRREQDQSSTLGDLIEEVRREQPDVDWDAVEGALFTAIAKNETAPPSTPVRRRPSLLSGLAAAAAVLLALLAVDRTAPSSTVPGATRTENQAAVDGGSLLLDQRVAAIGHRTTVNHDGRATWVLEPGGVAHLVGRGDRIVVSLDRGALTADVVPQPVKETFVVLVDRTRIAVHGTRFRVERQGGDVLVDVTEGVVAVGPAGGGPGRKLSAPATGRFDLTGTPRDDADTSATSSAPRARPHAQPRAARPDEALEPTRKETPAPVENEPDEETERRATSFEAGTARVEAAVRVCFEEGSVDRGDLRVSAQTSMTLEVDGTGRLVHIAFTPPLSPTVMSCVGDKTADLRFPTGPTDTRLERRLLLER